MPRGYDFTMGIRAARQDPGLERFVVLWCCPRGIELLMNA